MILPDVLEPRLRVVFCGTAAGRVSARVGAYYAGPGNAFWPTLHEVGLTPRRLAPSEFRELPRYGIGLTDMCKVRSGSDAEIGTDGFDVERLVAALEENAPGWITFTSKNAGRAALVRAVEYGRQPERLGPSRAFVLPSPSGAARGFWDVRVTGRNWPTWSSLRAMDGARARWTDERLDGFAALVDQRLNRADEQARRKRDEREQRRWDQSQQRFESRMRLIFWMYGVAVGMALGTIVTVLANRS